MGRGDNGQLFHAGDLRGHGRHQHGGRIRRRSARHAEARPIQWAIALPQISARPLDANILVQNGLLKDADILPHAADGLQKLRIGLGVGTIEFFLRNANRRGGQRRVVDAGGIVEHGRKALLLYVAANPLDHLPRRQRLAENLDRLPLSRLADDIPARAEFFPQFGHRPADIVPAAIDAADIEWG